MTVLLPAASAPAWDLPLSASQGHHAQVVTTRNRVKHHAFICLFHQQAQGSPVDHMLCLVPGKRNKEGKVPDIRNSGLAQRTDTEIKKSPQ